MTNFVFSVAKSAHCCAVYTLTGLTDISMVEATKKVPYGYIEAIKAKVTDIGTPKVLPLVVEFSDADEYGRGEALYKALLKAGYRCDKFELGNNPKSGNAVSLYHWFCHKSGPGKNLSLVREFKTDGQQQKTTTRKSGTIKGTGIAGGLRSRVGVLGSSRRTGTRF